MIPNLSDIKFDSITLSEKKNFPQFSVIYGSGGIGKTYLAVHTENPVIIPIGRETGQEAYINKGIPCFQAPEGMPALDFVFGAIAKLLKTNHNRKTVVFDNLGTYRECVDEDVEKDAGKDNDKLDAYGRRQALSYPYYTRLLAGFSALMTKKNMNIILIGHSVNVNINLGDSYYQRIGIHAPRGDNTNVAALLEARAHNIFYLKGETQTRKVKGPLGQDKVIATAGLKRTLFTKESGTFYAKSRFDIEEYYEIGDDESIKQLWRDVHK